VCLEDIRGRLDLLVSLGCHWWVLELRERDPLMTTLGAVREYLESCDLTGGANPPLES
jgi:hypothetical protein